MTEFERITPEAAGVPADAVRRFAEGLESRNINLHSFVMLKDGKSYVAVKRESVENIVENDV